MTIQYLLELAGTGFFAISGSIVATRRSTNDWFGVTFISFITSIGGGSIRDVLLGSYPLVWIKDINFMYAIITGVVFTSIFYKYLLKFRKLMFVFDTLGVAMFTIIGTEKAISFGVNPLIAAIMGMFSAVMGGVLRDILTNEIPILFRRELYASVCFGGAAFYLIADQLGCERNINFILSILVILVFRIVAVKYDLAFPKFSKVIEEGLE
jgi:uncharacterized membrane protein YeiH